MPGFIGLRSKCCVMLFIFMVMIKKIRNVRASQNTVIRTHQYDDHNQVLETREVIHRLFNCIRSKHHNIYSINTTQ